jgi:uncharacterized oxidoreductase
MRLCGKKEILMKISGNTILITGGSTGIGFSLAEVFVKAENEVIICGRREEKLAQAKSKLPHLTTMVCDVSKPEERESLYNWAICKFPDLNILVNNAGIQRRINFIKGIEEVRNKEDEVDINLTATIELSAWFIPEFLKKKEAAIINVSSGLGFIPIALMPVYCATKAAIHSFSISLRHQLKDTSIKVFEIIPPIVDTDLDRGARGPVNRGIKPDEVGVAALKGIEKDEYECVVGMAQNLVQGAKTNFDQIFNNMNH